MRLLIITGGSRGLGLSIIEEYEKKGWDIINLSRSGKNFNVITDLFDTEKSLKSISMKMDSIDISTIEELVIISNAATILPIKKTYKLTPAESQKNLTINILTPIVILNFLIDYFRNLNTPKTIVNISSGAALRGMSGWSLYCASKAAMENYINTLIVEEEVELHPYTSYNFDPGIMDTNMQGEIRNSSILDFPELDRFKEFKENGELRTPLEVAKLLIFLLEKNPKPGRYSVKELNFIN